MLSPICLPISCMYSLIGIDFKVLACITRDIQQRRCAFITLVAKLPRIPLSAGAVVPSDYPLLPTILNAVAGALTKYCPGAPSAAGAGRSSRSSI